MGLSIFFWGGGEGSDLKQLKADLHARNKKLHSRKNRTVISAITYSSYFNFNSSAGDHPGTKSPLADY